MKRSTMTGLTAAAVVLATALAPSSACADGKKAAFASDPNVTLNDGITGEGVILSTVITKGKKKHALAIEAAMQVNTLIPSLPSLHVNVNGVAANGPSLFLDCKNINTNGCPLAGSWWLDLDAAEAASPGTFIGQPLTVELIGGANTVAPPTNPQASASMTVRLEKK